MSVDNIIRVGDYGIPIIITVIDRATGVAVDLSTATLTSFVFKKPDGTKVTKTAVFSTDGTDGDLKYVVEQAFIDLAGRWKVQAVVVFPTPSGLTSDPAEFEVMANL